MSTRWFWITAIAALLTACGRSGEVVVNEPWIRGGPPGLQVLGGYMVMVNRSDQPDRLLRAVSPVFGSIELHRTSIENGIAKMEEVEFVEIPGRGEMEFAPSGYHLMLMQPKRHIGRGDNVPIRLIFENAASLELQFEVR